MPRFPVKASLEQLEIDGCVALFANLNLQMDGGIFGGVFIEI